MNCAFATSPIPTVSHPLALCGAMLCTAAPLSAPELGNALRLCCDGLVDEAAALAESWVGLGLTDAPCVSWTLLAVWLLVMAGIFGDAGSLLVLCLSSKTPFACDIIDAKLRGLELI